MRNLVTIFMAACAISANAQGSNVSSRYIEYQEYQVNKNYSDSLVAFKEKQNSQEVNDENWEEIVPDGRLEVVSAFREIVLRYKRGSVHSDQ